MASRQSNTPRQRVPGRDTSLSQNVPAVASAKYLEDADFQDALLKLLIFDEEALSQLGPKISPTNFDWRGDRRIIAGILLDFWNRSHTPIGSLLSTEVKEHIRLHHLHDEKAKALLECIEEIKSTSGTFNRDFLIKRFHESQDSWRILEAFREVADLAEAGQLTVQKFVDIAQNAAQTAQSKDDQGVHKMLGKAVMTSREFINKDLPRLDCIFDPALRERGLMLLFSKTGVGKTYVALSMGIAASIGMPLFYWHVPRPFRVMYVDGEMSQQDLQVRSRQIFDGFALAGTDSLLPTKNQDARRELFYRTFRFIINDALENQIPDLATQNGQAWLESKLRDVNGELPELLILDNVYSLMESALNDSDGWIVVARWLNRLKTMGIAVILVHHESEKPGNAGFQMGTTARTFNVHTVIHIRRLAQHLAEGSSPLGVDVELHFKKARGISPGTTGAAPFRLTLGTHPFVVGAVQWGVQTIQTSRYEQACHFLDEGWTPQEVAEKLGLSKRQIERYREQQSEGKNTEGKSSEQPDAPRKRKRCRKTQIHQ